MILWCLLFWRQTSGLCVQTSSKFDYLSCSLWVCNGIKVVCEIPKAHFIFFLHPLGNRSLNAYLRKMIAVCSSLNSLLKEKFSHVSGKHITISPSRKWQSFLDWNNKITTAKTNKFSRKVEITFKAKNTFKARNKSANGWFRYNIAFTPKVMNLNNNNKMNSGWEVNEIKSRLVRTSWLIWLIDFICQIKIAYFYLTQHDVLRDAYMVKCIHLSPVTWDFWFYNIMKVPIPFQKHFFSQCSTSPDSPAFYGPVYLRLSYCGSLTVVDSVTTVSLFSSSFYKNLPRNRIHFLVKKYQLCISVRYKHQML